MPERLRPVGLTTILLLSAISGLIVLGGTLPSARAAGVNFYPINLYFHNDTTNPMVGGYVRSTSTLNTTQAWRSQPQAFMNFTSRLARDFYLHPNLVGNFTINGTLWIHPWVVGSGSGGSLVKGGFTVALYDVSPSGQVAVGTSASSGSEDIAFGKSASQSEDVNALPTNAALKFTLSSYTFLPGHSILVHVEILPQGSGTVLSFYFDHQVTPSYVSLYSNTIVSVAKAWTADSAGSPRSVFSPTAGNLAIQILANVTDPLGGYDVNASGVGFMFGRVTVDLTNPSSTKLIANQRTTLFSGGQTSFQNIFRLNVTLTAPSKGQYNYTFTAIDNSANMATGIGTFSVGQASPQPQPITSTAAFQIGLAFLIVAIIVTALFLGRRSRKGAAQSKVSTASKT